MEFETLEIVLPKALADRVRERVNSGFYATDSEVVTDALERMESTPDQRAARLAEIREKIDTARRNPGRLTHDEVVRNLTAYMDSRATR